MSACEKCWTDASEAVMTRGGSVVDHYHRLLKEREDQPCAESPEGVSAGASVAKDHPEETLTPSGQTCETCGVGGAHVRATDQVLCDNCADGLPVSPCECSRDQIRSRRLVRNVPSGAGMSARRERALMRAVLEQLAVDHEPYLPTLVSVLNDEVDDHEWREPTLTERADALELWCDGCHRSASRCTVRRQVLVALGRSRALVVNDQQRPTS